METYIRFEHTRKICAKQFGFKKLEKLQVIFI